MSSQDNLLEEEVSDDECLMDCEDGDDEAIGVGGDINMIEVDDDEELLRLREELRFNKLMCDQKEAERQAVEEERRLEVERRIAEEVEKRLEAERQVAAEEQKRLEAERRVTAEEQNDWRRKDESLQKRNFWKQRDRFWKKRDNWKRRDGPLKKRDSGKRTS